VSFRSRLTVFFLLIVVVPMVAIAALVVSIANDSRSGKADARLAEGLSTAQALYRHELRASGRVANSIAGDPVFQAALRGGDRAKVAAAVRRAAQDHNAPSVAVTDPRGHVIAAIGPKPQAAAARSLLLAPNGDRAGSLTASVTTPRGYLGEVHRSTGLDATLLGDAGPVSSTIDFGAAELPASGESRDVDLSEGTLRVAASNLGGAVPLRLALFGPVEAKGFLSSSPLVLAALIGFFAVALVFVAMLLRALGGQVGRMLGAARRIGEGDFSGEVPVVGNDEMAGLASEFNKMRERLAEQVAELRSQRDEIDRSVQRIGQAFASGLDRRVLLEIIVDTALTACRADYGIIALGGRAGDEVERGEPTGELRDAMLAAEERGSREGVLVEHSSGGVAVLSSPLPVPGEPARRGGVMSVARSGPPFDTHERDVFVYLLGQAAASIENISLHELVSEQAVTDDLTGLSNKRRFRELLEKEAARAQRFGHDLSLLMLDIDDFKRINDTHGHLQGDEVLRRIAAALDTESRGVDEPARYGGEEFAIALPETGLEGALEVAERIRTRIASQEVPLLDGEGSVGITASIGAATMSGEPDDIEGLIAAADAALYEAKAAGKDRVVGA
jgi:diguanylate cyclase (GGDEF)-like protein